VGSVQGRKKQVILKKNIKQILIRTVAKCHHIKVAAVSSVFIN
jgi:hypothetical protein